MSVRTATHHIASIADFLKEYEETLRIGAIVLTPAELGGEPAAEVRIDLVLPLIGRKGPMLAQVVQRGPDGATAFRIPEIPHDVSQGFRALLAAAQEVKSFLLASGEVVLPPSGSLDAVEVRAERRPVDTPVAARHVGRGFFVPDLSGLVPVARGVLGNDSLREAIIAAAIDHMTGLFVIAEREGPKRFGFWSHGGPVGWRTDPVDESEVLGVLLFRAGRVTEEQVAQSLKLMAAEGIRQGEALMRMGVITFHQLVIMLQKQVEILFLKVTALEAGNWAFYELGQLPENFAAPPLRVINFLFRALKTKTTELPFEAIYGSQKPNLDRYVVLRKGVERILDEVAFSNAEKKLMEILRSSSWRLRELFSISNVSRNETASLLWALSKMRLLEYRDEETSSRSVARVVTRIHQKFQQLQAGSHFDILELHWICLGPEIDASYARLKKEFQLMAYPDLPPELVSEVKAIQVALEEAYDVLAKENQRRLYRENLIERSMIDSSAELLGKKGEMALMKKDMREASTCYAKAHELRPRSVDFLAGMERAKQG
jgi:hypothetical protein